MGCSTTQPKKITHPPTHPPFPMHPAARSNRLLLLYPLSTHPPTHPTVVQRKGLFNDPAEEINHLMYAIKEDIQGLNTLVEATQVGGWVGGWVGDRKMRSKRVGG